MGALLSQGVLMSDKDYLEPQDIDFTQICSQFGTPTYIYGTARISSNYKSMRAAFDNIQHRIMYSASALANLSILRYLNTLNSGLHAVSLGQVHMALYAGFKPDEIIYTPSSVNIGRIATAVEWGVHFTIDSNSLLNKFGQKFGSSKSCIIRLNPNIVTSEEAVDSPDKTMISKFGISHDRLDEMLEIIDKYGIEVRGLHFHCGSAINNDAYFHKAILKLFTLATRLPQVDLIDLGGGFAQLADINSDEMPIARHGEILADAVKSFKAKTSREINIWLEPGQLLVGNAGYFLTRVEDIKIVGDTTLIGVDTGFNHFLIPKLDGHFHEIINISNSTAEKATYTVAGNTSREDFLGIDLEISEVRSGDILCIMNAGAYGFSMASNFDSRCRPAEVLFHKGRAYLIRTREIFDDLLRNQPASNLF